MIEIHTLGDATIRREGVELPALAAHRQKLALLVYTAIEGPVARDRVLALLWPERDEGRARHSLRQAIYSLKRELGEECVQIEGDRLAITAGTCSLDAKELEAAAEGESWEKVVGLYDGPFLQGFSLPGAPDFEGWVSDTRARLARLASRAFRSVTETRRQAGDMPSALAAARRWATFEPLDDEAQHTLIDLLFQTGDHPAALTHYEAYRERLAQVLGAEPLPKTLALAERIRAAELPPKDRGATGLSALIEELRSRRIVRVAAVFLGAAWLAVEAADILVDREVLPNWTFYLTLYLFAIGLPITLGLAWAHDRRRAVAGRPLPAWARNVRPVHVLLLLALLVLAPPAYVLVTRGGGERQPSIDATAPFAATRIAVLYFDDHSEGGQLAHIANSLTEHLTHQLAQVERLDVLPRNALKPYRDQGISRDTIARQLEVGMLVEGSVTGTREQVRVSVQLIDARAMTHLMSSVIDGSADDPFALLDQVGDSIARLLRERLGEEIRLREWRAGTSSPEAWEYVQRATRFSEEADLMAGEDTAAALTALQIADRLLARAEAADPEWIEPIVLRGWLASSRSMVLGPGRSRDVASLLDGVAHADRALTLDTANASTLELRGILLSALAEETEDSEDAARLEGEAERELTKALDIDPTLARAWSRLSLIHRNRGNFRAALIAAERAYEADAFLDDARVVLYWLCYNALNLKDWDRVARWCGEGQRRYPNRETFVAAALVALAGPEGPPPDVEHAWQLQQKYVELSPEDVAAVTRSQALMQVAAVLVRAGLADSARAVIDRARAGIGADDPWTGYYEANARLQLGDTVQALNLLAALLEAEPRERGFIASDWWWESLHDDPRFQALVGTPD